MLTVFLEILFMTTPHHIKTVKLNKRKDGLTYEKG